MQWSWKFIGGLEKFQPIKQTSLVLLNTTSDWQNLRLLGELAGVKFYLHKIRVTNLPRIAILILCYNVLAYRLTDHKVPEQLQLFMAQPAFVNMSWKFEQEPNTLIFWFRFFEQAAISSLCQPWQVSVPAAKFSDWKFSQRE